MGSAYNILQTFISGPVVIYARGLSPPCSVSTSDLIQAMQILFTYSQEGFSINAEKFSLNNITHLFQALHKEGEKS